MELRTPETMGKQHLNFPTELYGSQRTVINHFASFLQFNHCTNKEAKVTFSYCFTLPLRPNFQSWSKDGRLKACPGFSHLEVPNYECASFKFILDLSRNQGS